MVCCQYRESSYTCILADKYLAFSPLCRFAPRLFAPWLFRPLARSPPGLFAPWLIRQRTLDDSGGERARGRTSQGAKEPGGESSRGETAKGRISHNSADIQLLQFCLDTLRCKLRFFTLLSVAVF